MRIYCTFLLAALVGACGLDPARTGDEPDAGGTPDAGLGEEPKVEFCTGGTSGRWDPAGGALDALPDDYWTTDDEASPTGVKVNLTASVPSTLSRFSKVYRDLGRLDGFGVNAAITLRFDGPLDRASLPVGGEGSGLAGESVMLVALTDDGVELLDFELSVVQESSTNEASTLVVAPFRPLEPSTRHALVVTTKAKAADAGCIAPAPAFKEVLEGTATDAGLVRLQPRWEEVVERLRAAGAIAARGELSAGVVFTTQSVTGESVKVANDIRTRTVGYTAGSCTATNRWRACEGTLHAKDYRTNRTYLADGTPQADSNIPVTTWLPLTGTGPFPTIVMGHGLGGDRRQGEYLAQGAALAGYAVIAIDAVKHGNHPDAASSPQFAVIDFFGITLFGGDTLDSRKLADNFRQSTYDKLQLVRALGDGLDVDGQEGVDVSADRLIYVGVSLGGIMGPELLALAPEFDVAVALVPGARLADILRDSSQFSQAVSFMRGQATDGDLARFYAVLQAAADHADAGAWAPWTLHRRLPGFDAQKPQFLMQMVLNDDIVPNSANRYFARSVGLPLAGDELQPVGSGRIATLPAVGNVSTGLTAGLYQLDIVAQGTAATHNNAPGSQVAWTQVGHFIETWLETGTSEIIDAYRVVGLK